MLGAKSYTEIISKLNVGIKELLLVLIALGLLKPLGKCSKCRRPRQLGKNSHYKEGYAIRCVKCKYFVSLFDKGFFQDLHIPIKKYLEVIFCWANELDQKDTTKLTGLRRGSVNQCFRYLRDIVSWKLLNSHELFTFGGPGAVVQIDESVVAKRKYNRGRVVKEKWVLGIYDTQSKRGVIVYVPKRNAATILPIIAEYVLPGTEIWTDCWRAYNELPAMGYIHKTVNHSQNFKDPVTNVCTNAVEGMWGTLKRYLRKRSAMWSVHLPEHIDEYMWRKTFINSNNSAFRMILHHIQEKYPL